MANSECRRLTFEEVSNLAGAIVELGQGRDIDDVLSALAMVLSFTIVNSADSRADRLKLLASFANYVAAHLGLDNDEGGERNACH